jgi:hypothetical protein
MVNLLDVEIPVTWYEFHEFAIERTPSEVIYSIDGQEVARVPDAFAGALPVGVWNDRWSMMLTDWVEVCRVESPILDVKVDIKPGSCPNPLNLAAKGNLPVAILGSEDLDVNEIDPTSVRLKYGDAEGVAPIRSNLEDVATPVIDGNECDCNMAGPDGYTDLTLKFETTDIVDMLVYELGDAEYGTADVDPLTLVFTLTGQLNDGTAIEGSDCMVLVGRVPEALAARKADINEDGAVNFADLGLLKKYFWKSNLNDD